MGQRFSAKRMTLVAFDAYRCVRQEGKGPIGDGLAAQGVWQFLKRSKETNFGEDTRNLKDYKMRLSFHPGASQLTFLSLALLCPIPRLVSTYPQSSTALLPKVNRPELESALQHLQAALEDLKDPVTMPEWPQDHLSTLLEPGEEEEAENDDSWEEEALLRAERDFMDLPLSPFAGDNSVENMHFQDGGEGEEGWKRNDALTSMAGGLQAVSREKGGFGFRFGRKRWIERGRLDAGMRGQEVAQRTPSESNKRGIRKEIDGRKKM